MSSGTGGTVLALVAGIVALALILPIFFDVEYPSTSALTFIEKSFCTIIANGGGNITCVTADEFLFFNGTGITIMANDTTNTITFLVDANGTIVDCIDIGSGEGVCSGPVSGILELKSLIGAGGINVTSDANSVTIDGSNIIGGGSGGENNTGSSLGGDVDVFRDKTGVNLNFRGLTAGNGIDLIESLTDILLNVTLTLTEIADVPATCAIEEVLKFNATSGEWECETDIKGGVEFAVIQAGSGQLQLPPPSTPVKITATGTNYDFLVLDYDDSPSQSQSAIFFFQLPPDFDPTSNIDFRVQFQTDIAGGGVCFDGSILAVNVPSDWDSAFTATVGGCNTSLQPVGDLNQIDLNFTSAQHGALPTSFIVWELSRDTADASDTNADDARFIGSGVRWQRTA